MPALGRILQVQPSELARGRLVLQEVAPLDRPSEAAMRGILPRYEPMFASSVRCGFYRLGLYARLREWRRDNDASFGPAAATRLNQTLPQLRQLLSIASCASGEAVSIESKACAPQSFYRVIVLPTAAVSRSATSARTSQPSSTRWTSTRSATVTKRRPTSSLTDIKTTRDFVSLLPATLTMTDLIRREKFTDLPRAISTEGNRRTRTKSTPPAGDAKTVRSCQGRSCRRSQA